MKRWIENVRVWDGGEGFVDGGVIRIDGGSIESVVAGRAPAETPHGVERLDGGRRLAVPGLVNAHTHLYSSLARGMALPGYSPASFTEILEQLWWRLDKALDPESVRASALAGAMEAARCGVTTLIDHHASPRAIPGSLDILKNEVCGRLGLRAALCYELSDRDGPSARDEGIEENARFLRSGSGDSGMCAGLFGLHASFTLSDETLGRVAERIPNGAGIHIHVAEGPEDETSCVAEHGRRIVHRLDRFGLLRPSSLLAHCLHIDGEEKDLVAERGSIVVHNPRSNMNNAVGVFDLPGFLDRGIRVGLGTDGLGANMLSELFSAALLQKIANRDSLAAPFAALETLLFRNNPSIAGDLLGVRLGRIAPGHAADIALLDYEPPAPLAAGNVLGHLLFGAAVHTLHVGGLVVAGKPILWDGRFTTVDEEEVYARARGEAERLWKRAAEIPGRIDHV
jgi:putative selenium metabolism protein SsnA